MWIMWYGNVNELGDISRDPGKSSLFFLTGLIYEHPEIGLAGDGVSCQAKHHDFLVSGAFLTILENPRERFYFHA